MGINSSGNMFSLCSANYGIEKLIVMEKQGGKNPTVSVTYFKPDDKKTGGEYVTATGIFQKFRDYERTIVLEDGTDIECDRIVEIRGI